MVRQVLIDTNTPYVEVQDEAAFYGPKIDVQIFSVIGREFTLATNQVEISPVHQPLLLDGTLDQLQQLRIRPMAWSCLGGGRLFNEEGFQALRDELAQVAHELNADSIEQVVYAWVLRLPSQPLPIIGSGKIERVRSAIVAEKLSMTRQQWFRIRKAALGYDVP